MTVTNRAVRRQPLVSVHSLDARRIWQRCHCAPRRGPRRAWKPSPPTTLTRVACSIKEATRLTRSETWSLFAAMQMRMPGAARAALATMMKQACDQALLNTPRRDLCRKKLRRTITASDSTASDSTRDGNARASSHRPQTHEMKGRGTCGTTPGQ